MKNLGLLTLLFLLLITSCREDFEGEITIVDTPDPTIIEGYIPSEKIINGSVIGFVVDENQEPMAYVKVIFGDIILTTDHFGHFFLDDVNMNALGSLVKAESEGYFTGSRRFFPITGAKNRVKIEMIKKNFNIDFHTEEGGLIEVEGGGNIQFSPNSIQLEDGTLYDGVVKVAAKWMNPTHLRTFDQMPGSLQGVGQSSQNIEVTLGTYGMMAIELQSESGEKLNIADGFAATLTMPVPEYLQANAPSEIILWSYNERYGIWYEESVARLQNRVYIGEVNHFSFWNCDAFFESIHLTVNLKDDNNLVLPGYLVTITVNEIGTTGGYTDNNGRVAGLVPANKELLLRVFDFCGNTISEAPLGAFSTDAETFISPDFAYNTLITGEFICNGNPSEDGGLILVQFEQMAQYYYIENSNFELNLRTCFSTSEIEIRAINLATLEESESSTVSIEENIDLGALDICNLTLGIDQYIIMTVNNESILYVEPYVSIGDSAGITITQFYALPIDDLDSKGTSFYYEGALSTGSFEDSAIFKWYRNETYNWEFTSSPPSTPNLSSFIITEYGEPGAYITGNFETTLLNTGVDPAEEVVLECRFRVKRLE